MLILNKEIMSTRNSKWYLDRTDELSMVTDEASNPALGIIDITIYQPTANMMKSGTVARITLKSIIGNIENINVKEGDRNPGEIYLNVSSRNYIDKDGKKQYVNDVKLANPVKAQILSYISTFLVDVPQNETQTTSSTEAYVNDENEE